MNSKKIKFLTLTLVAVLGITGSANINTFNNNTVSGSEVNDSEIVTTRTPSGWMLLRKYFGDQENKNKPLQLYDDNSGVKGLNDFLFDTGYLSDLSDDEEEEFKFTLETQAAVKKLQKDLGVKVTGKFSYSDWVALKKAWGLA